MPESAYTEREVNQVLVEYHDDVAALRRGRERSKGTYRVAGTPGASQDGRSLKDRPSLETLDLGHYS